MAHCSIYLAVTQDSSSNLSLGKALLQLHDGSSCSSYAEGELPGEVSTGIFGSLSYTISYTVRLKHSDTRLVSILNIQ